MCVCTPIGCVLCSRLMGDQERKNQRCELSCRGTEVGAEGAGCLLSFAAEERGGACILL